MERSWKYEWTRALKDLEEVIDIPPHAINCGEIVKIQYELPEREHHGIDHIYNGLDLIQLYENETRTPVMPQVRYCWMLHDVKYDPKEKNNEELSAYLASVIVNNDFVIDPILSTKAGHEGSTIAGRIIRDVDWSYFGLEYDDFKETRNKIRKEYNHLSDDDWRAGSLAFLENLVPRDIFFTPLFKKMFLDNAKINIEKMCKELENK